MSDPSLLVTCATASDPALAPPGRHTYYVLAPAPNLDARLDWSVIGPRYRDEVVETLERRGWVGFESGIEVESVTTPGGLAGPGPGARSAVRGCPHVRPDRPASACPTSCPGVDNVVLAGSGTVPGVGVPMVLVSGRLAAQRITGADVQRRPRATQGEPAGPASSRRGAGSSSRSQSANSGSGIGRASSAPCACPQPMRRS